MTLDINTIPQLVDDIGMSMMMEAYGERPLVYPSICDVRAVSGMSNLYGEKGTVMQGVGDFKEREDGQEIEADQPGQGPTWLLKVRQYSRRIDIPKRMLDGADAAAKIPNLIGEFAQDFGRKARHQKEGFVAGMLQDGTLTAGSTTYFDNGFVGEVDSNSGFIYDGLPFFDTAHTITGGSSTYGNHTVSLALSAANLQTVLVAMRSTNAVNERGDRILITPDTLVVGPDLEYTARVILQSALLPGSANNDINAVAGALQLVVDPAITSTGTWWVCEARKGLRVRDSGMPVLEPVWNGLTKTWSITAEYHFGGAVTDWRHWYCANKAAS